MKLLSLYLSSKQTINFNYTATLVDVVTVDTGAIGAVVDVEEFFFSYCSNDNNQDSGQVEPVVIVGSKGGVAFWTLSLARLVTRSQTVETKDMETFGQNGVLASDFT